VSHCACLSLYMCMSLSVCVSQCVCLTMFAKQLKCGHFSILYNLLHLAFRWGFGKSRVIAVLGKKQYRLLRLNSFSKGFFEGFLTPVDKEKELFIEKN